MQLDSLVIPLSQRSWPATSILVDRSWGNMPFSGRLHQAVGRGDCEALTSVNITIDYLLIEEATKRPLTLSANTLSRSYDVEQLNDKERDTLAEVFDALIARSRVRTLFKDMPK